MFTRNLCNVMDAVHAFFSRPWSKLHCWENIADMARGLGYRLMAVKTISTATQMWDHGDRDNARSRNVHSLLMSIHLKNVRRWNSRGGGHSQQSYLLTFFEVIGW